MNSIYLRLSIEDACNLRCRYCRPERDLDLGEPDWEEHPLLGTEDLLELVAACQRVRPIRKLRLTGGEPLIRSDVVDLVSRFRERFGQAEICLTSNGFRLTELAGPLRRAGLDRINLSLDTLDPDAYRELTRGGDLDSALAGIQAARQAGFETLKLNTVLVRSVNGGHLHELVRFALDQHCEVRFIELMPISVAAGIHRDEFYSADEALAELREHFEDRGEASSTSTALRRRLALDGREFTVGFIPSVSHPFCADCDRLRMDCRGRLFACLRRADGLDLAGALARRDLAELDRRIERVIAAKCPPQSVWPGRQMSAIGG